MQYILKIKYIPRVRKKIKNYGYMVTDAQKPSKIKGFSRNQSVTTCNQWLQNMVTRMVTKEGFSMICFDKFEKIKTDTDLTSVIESYGFKFRKGKCLCIFHNDSTPSMSVKDGRYRCWACGASGDVFDWVQKYFSLSLAQAARKICNDFNLPYMDEQLTRHERLILKREERHRNALKQIAEHQEEKLNKQYWAMLDEYRRLKEYVREAFTDKSVDESEFSQNLARLQYLEQIVNLDSEEVKEIIGRQL